MVAALTRSKLEPLRDQLRARGQRPSIVVPGVVPGPATSVELIVPLTSPLNIGKVGVSAFVDSGTVYNHGERFADQTLKQGVGGSVWFAAAFVRVNVAVAHGLGSSTRIQAGGNITF